MTRQVTLLTVTAFITLGCDMPEEQQPRSASGVRQARAKVTTDSRGTTAEQRNITKRLVEDNLPGSVKHLYIVSAYSGQVIFYSTVDGKVTSGGKRLTPMTIADGAYSIPFRLGTRDSYTDEVIQDDGTYGHSGEYLFWWDTAGRYFQYYVTGGVIPIISSEQLTVRGVVITMETRSADGTNRQPPALAATPAPPPMQ